MVSLIEFLPLDHPLRKERALVAAQTGAKRISGHYAPQHFTPLFLTTKKFLSKDKSVVTQDYAGESAQEVLELLAKKFKPSELLDLSQGIPVDSDDGKYQYYLRPKLPKDELGLIPKPAKKKPQKKQETTMAVTSTKGWGARIKKLRSEAGFSQEAMTKKVTAKFFNIFSPAELEQRKLGPEERRKFFEVIGLPEDESIPVADEAEMKRRASFKGGKRVAKPERKSILETAKKNDAERAKKKLAKIDKKKKVEPKKVVKKEVTKPVVKTKASAPKKVVPTQAPVVPVMAIPVAPAAPFALNTLEPTMSPVKQAAFKDFANTIGNPNLNDSQVSEIMNLFKSLTLSVLMK